MKYLHERRGWTYGKSKHRVLRAPLEQQVRIEDSHAAIVTQEEFEQAQKVIMLQHGNHQAGNYTKHQYADKRLVGVYIDITGNKEMQTQGHSCESI